MSVLVYFEPIFNLILVHLWSILDKFISYSIPFLGIFQVYFRSILNKSVSYSFCHTILQLCINFFVGLLWSIFDKFDTF